MQPAAPPQRRFGAAEQLTTKPHKLVSPNRTLVLRKGSFVFLALVQFLCVPLAPRATGAIQEAPRCGTEKRTEYLDVA